jgi:hypothetical protein
MKKQAFCFVLYSLLFVCISLALGGCQPETAMPGVYVYDANNQFLGYLCGGIVESGDDRYVTVMTKEIFIVKYKTDGTLLSSPIYYTGAGQTGTPLQYGAANEVFFNTTGGLFKFGSGTGTPASLYKADGTGNTTPIPSGVTFYNLAVTTRSAVGIPATVTGPLKLLDQ